MHAIFYEVTNYHYNVGVNTVHGLQYFDQQQNKYVPVNPTFKSKFM